VGPAWHDNNEHAYIDNRTSGGRGDNVDCHKSHPSCAGERESAACGSSSTLGQNSDRSTRLTQRHESHGVGAELKNWRQGISIRSIKSQIANGKQDSYSLGVLASGGMLDTIAAVRAGFHPIWGSEIDTDMKAMWEDMTNTSSVGDMANVDFENLRRPVVMISGTPCVSYSSLGNRQGGSDPRGALYIKQGYIIDAVQPDAAIIEQTANVVEINDAKEVKELCNILGNRYYVHTALVPVWEFGDPTNRVRLFIVAIHKKHCDNAKNYRFPSATCDEMHYPTAADVAEDDDDVPHEYVLSGQPLVMHAESEPVPGTMHVLGRYGAGAGDCHNPHNLHGWTGLANCQLTSNGGGRRPMRRWRQGEPIYETRLTTPNETVAMASLPPSYRGWAGKFKTGDVFLRKLVNNGVPQRTSHAISASVFQLLQAAGVPCDVPAPAQQGRAAWAYHADTMRPTNEGWGHPTLECIHSIMVDTGANISCTSMKNKKHLTNTSKSQVQLGIAEAGTLMIGDTDGTANIMAINTTMKQGFKTITPFSFQATSIPGIRTELLSLDTAFRDGGYNILLKQPEYEDGVSEMYKPASDGEDEVRIPLRYDHEYGGSWWIDFIFDSEEHLAKQYLEAIAIHTGDIAYAQQAEGRCYRQLAINNSYTRTYAACMTTRLMRSKEVSATSVANGNDKTEEQEPPVCIDENTEDGQEVTYLAAHADDKEIKGTKEGLKSKIRKMNHQRFHSSRGHLGYCENCEVCIAAKGTMRRITSKVGAYRDTRPGYLWSMDTVTFSHRSLDSRAKYMVTLRCKSSGAIYLLYLHRKSDFCAEFERWVMMMRSDPHHQGMGYDIVQTVHTDNAGEWGIDTTNFQELKQRLKINVIYATPETSKELGSAERTNGIVEVIIKAILLEENLPCDHWEAAARGAQFLLNRFPNTATDNTAPIDGDRERPLEKLTRGAYSRRQIDRELSYYVQVGRVALVHQPVKGSTLAPKVRWAVAWNMVREVPTWRCPYTGYTFRSKSFTAFELNRRLNYMQFLGLPEKKTMGHSIALPMDEFERVDVQLPEPHPAEVGAQLPIIRIKAACETESKEAVVTASTGDKDTPMTRSKHHAKGKVISNHDGAMLAEMAQPELIDLLADEQPQESRKDVRHTPSTNVQPMWEPRVAAPHVRDKSFGAQSRLTTHRWECENECGFDAQTEEEVETHEAHCQLNVGDVAQQKLIPAEDDRKDPKQGTKNARYQAAPRPGNSENPCPEDDYDLQMAYIDLGTTEDADNANAIEKVLAEKNSHKSHINESFDTICRKMHKIPFEFIDIYHKWLHLLINQDGSRRFKAADLPRGRQSVKPDLMIPPPYGPIWQQLLDEKGLKWKTKYQAYEAVQLQQAAVETSMRRHVFNCKLARALAENMPPLQHLTEDDMKMPEAARAAAVSRAMAVRKKRVAKSDAAGVKPPKSIMKAIRDEDAATAAKWVESIETEWNGLNNIPRDDPSAGKGVFEHNMTKAMLREKGITKNPIPLSVCLTYKFDSSGEVTKFKTRMAVAGHSGHMKKGIDYDKTYASTPTHHSCRVMQATMVKYRLHRKAYDVAQAYPRAALPEEQQVPIRYPDGYKRYCPETGEEMYMLLVMNLYGLPQGGRLWEQRRNKVIIETFNKDGYSCSRSRKEPCMFIIKKGDEKCFMLIHTDDVDTIGTTMELLDDIHKLLGEQWECKEVDAGYMLGMQRTIKDNKGVMEVEITMTAFIESMMQEFKQYKVAKAIQTPLTPGVFLHKPVKGATGKRTAIEDAESAELIKKGYQSLLGSLLWAARGVFPECICGTSMLGRVLATPTQLAFNEAVVMLNYMYQNRTRGIKFSEAGNKVPIAFVDASNKPDPTDSKCQYGFVHIFQAGPIIFTSRKLNHVGLSALHNEYMALSWCNRHTMWLRELLAEMGMAECASQPTATYCDNTAAIMLAEEDIVSTGNQFITTPYHYNKEVEEAKQVKTIYVKTAENIADLFTKAVSRPVVQTLLAKTLGYDDPTWMESLDTSRGTHKEKKWPVKEL
jgi:site-specific DNA-cytosine methylase